MYVETPHVKVRAMDATDRTEVWRFDPFNGWAAGGAGKNPTRPENEFVGVALGSYQEPGRHSFGSGSSRPRKYGLKV